MITTTFFIMSDMYRFMMYCVSIPSFVFRKRVFFTHQIRETPRKKVIGQIVPVSYMRSFVKIMRKMDV